MAAQAEHPGPVRPESVRRGYLAGVAAAVTFGASAPLAKRFGQSVDAQLLAALLSGGAFVAVAPVAARRRVAGHDSPLGRRDVAPLAGLVLLGGVVAPVLLMVGLQRVTGIGASLLLNLEGPLTVAVGVALFGEHLTRRATAAAALVFGGAVVLGTAGQSAGTADAIGVLLIAGACLGWAVDNNLTQRLTVRDPFAIVAWKTGVAAAANLSLAVVRSTSWPAAGALAALVATGAVGYGASVVADAYALRHLGAAREAAVFAVAPFAGVVVAVAVLGEPFTAAATAALLLMAAGLALLLADRHGHVHRHDRLAHEHRHDHDEYHVHDHAVAPDGGAHAHPHVHDPLEHRGEHVSDVHHRHAHEPPARARFRRGRRRRR